MFLQILPTVNAVKVSKEAFDLELFLVVLGLTVSVFLVLIITNYFIKTKLNKE